MSMSVTNSQRVHHHKTNSYQQSPTSACISKVYQNSLLSFRSTSVRTDALFMFQNSKQVSTIAKHYLKSRIFEQF